MNPFDFFPEAIIPCTFLELNVGGILGNTVKQRYDFGGIVKTRNGMTVSNNLELLESSTTVHIRSNEPFTVLLSDYALNGFVGCGIEVTKNGRTQAYRITGYPDGYDFDTGVTEFYRLTLKAESLADYVS